jgi:hypothetical protein
MVTIQQTSLTNIEGTMNAAFITANAAFSLPSWMPTRPTVEVVNWKDAALTTPSYALIHIPVSLPNTFQGMNVGNSKRGTKYLGILEVSCWVSQFDDTSNVPNQNWLMQLRTMADFVQHWALSTKVLVIQDYAANPDTPSATEYKINFGDIAPLVHQPDSQNPALIRKRILLDYWFTYRVT